MGKYDLWAAGLLLLLGVVATVESWRLVLGAVGKPGPGFFPFYLALGLSVSSLSLLVQSFLNREVGSGFSLGPINVKGMRQAAWVLLGLFLYAFIFEKFGFFLSTFVVMVFLLRAVAAFDWLFSLGGSFVSALLSYFLFKVWLQVQLPAGPWGL